MTTTPPLRGPQSRVPILCLAGFMGSGKTTIGTLLARQLAWRFVDLDERIEASAGLAIPEIFERLGEPAFRQIEADQLRAALGRAAEMKESTVLALGGGTYAQRALHAQRLPSYQLADYRVDSSGEPTQVVAEILRRGIVASGGNAAHLVVEKPLP